MQQYANTATEYCETENYILVVSKFWKILKSMEKCLCIDMQKLCN